MQFTNPDSPTQAPRPLDIAIDLAIDHAATIHPDTLAVLEDPELLDGDPEAQ